MGGGTRLHGVRHNLHGHKASAAPNCERFWGGNSLLFFTLLLRGGEMCCERTRHLSDPGNRSQKNLLAETTDGTANKAEQTPPPHLLLLTHPAGPRVADRQGRLCWGRLLSLL